MTKHTSFSQSFTVFHDRLLPEAGSVLAGYAALLATYCLPVPTPEILVAISKKHQKYQKNGWLMLTPRHAPEDSLYGHLAFALKYEGVNLAVLKALFDHIAVSEITYIVEQHSTSAYRRKIWFLYEWLQGRQLELPNATKGKIVDVLNTALQYPGPARFSKRHRIQNNLPGTPAFCPIIRRTEKLEQLISMNLSKKAQQMMNKMPHDMVNRAAAFMLLKDSKASFAIEHEIPPQTRAERWGQAIADAGTVELSHDEFLRLQQIIISDFRFTHLGYRNEGGFIGEHERGSGMPLPVHISARWQDIWFLMDGLIETSHLLKTSDMDPVLSATIIAFGFVFIHPLADGNGRMHRYLIHHMLAEKKFNLSHIVFPISAVMLDRIDEYRKALESYSRPRLRWIKWYPTVSGNVEVTNDTIDLYRYCDLTQQAEFLYACIKETIEKTLPSEIDFLKKYDAMKVFIKNYIDMPDRMIDLLIRFLQQENGKLSKRAKRKEFSALRAEEVTMLEKKYAEIFDES